MNEAVLIDPATGEVLGKGSTPTSVVSDLQREGRPIYKSNKKKKK